MKKKGWIKFFRHECDLFSKLNLSDRDICYYLASRVAAIWDTRNQNFGTFDARAKVMRETLLPHWSLSKINEVKNSLLRHGAYQKTTDPRLLKIANAEVLFAQSRRPANGDANDGKILRKHGNELREFGNKIAELKRRRGELARNKSTNK